MSLGGGLSHWQSYHILFLCNICLLTNINNPSIHPYPSLLPTQELEKIKLKSKEDKQGGFIHFN